jgi:phosphohistidine swiveling domain-containing protein
MKKHLTQKIKWYRMISRGRHHAILIIDSGVGVPNQKNYPRKIYNIPLQIKYYRQFDGSRWISEKEHLLLNKLFGEIMKRNPKFLYQWAAKMEKNGLNIISLVNRYKNQNWVKLSNKKLVQILGKFHDAVGKLWGGVPFYAWYFFFNEIYLERLRNILEKKLKEEDFRKIWQFVIQPEKITFIGQEKLALLKLVQKFITSKKVPEKYIKAHLNKFAFVNKYYFWGEGLTYKQIKNELRKIIRSGRENIAKELRSFKLLKLDLNKFPLSINEKWVIKGFKKMAYVSNFADEVINYYTYHLKPLFSEIAQRLNISYEELVSMRFQEIKESLIKQKLLIPRKKLQERYKDHALIYVGDKVYILTGKSLEKYRKKELKEEVQPKIKEFKGTVAFKTTGSIKGNVMVIKSNEQINSFKKGMILVTQMTNPTYLPAMKKSKAIITDEGGLLCHAAIVSRELKTPCIIGTKIATKVLKDGDLVEVDANEGIVRILKKKCS